MKSRIPHRLLSACFVLWTCDSAIAQLSNNYPRPPAKDAESWNGYCAGVEKEVQRQATEDNNQLLFNETRRRRTNLSAQMVHFFRTQEWSGKPSELDWMAQGEKVAGKDVWDVMQLANGDNQLRATMRIVRQNDLSTCDDLADRDVVYVSPTTR